MKKLIKNCVLPLTISLASATALAQEASENGGLTDAWLDGKLGTVIVLNSHLNPFKIETDVVDGVAIITGKVNSPVHKDLAEELALSVEGIDSVENRLVVSTSEGNKLTDSQVVSTALDSTITTAISTKLLLNSSIDSSAIDVDTANQNVYLSGVVDSLAVSNLVEQIALNTFEVELVVNNLEVIQ